jgi:histidinol-phosphate aminotransferase
VFLSFHISSPTKNQEGIRIGYGAVPLWLMNYCWRVKQPYNVSVLAEEAACAALESKEYLQVKFI